MERAPLQVSFRVAGNGDDGESVTTTKLLGKILDRLDDLTA